MATRIEEGRYKARCLSWAFGMTSTGKPQIGAVFDVQAEEGPVQLTWYGLMHDEKSAKRTMSSMRACGWDGKGPVTEAQGLDQNDVDVTVEDNEWDGEVSSRIAWVNGAGAAVKPMKEEDKAKLNARLAQWQKPGSSPAKTRQAAPAAPAPEAGAADDDIPF
jgi:hypothetical protein